MPPNPSTNSEIQRYYQAEPRFNGVYSRNDLWKNKGWESSINLDDYKLAETHWIAFLCE